MFKIRSFEGNPFTGMTYYHIKLLGLKFRLVITKRKAVSKFNTYTTGRGRVFNIGKLYISTVK
jgi:hypothetical protein|tara:strand:- start:133 stop:321 length:189 start_codon:yes stop_codon:yes gene_type:complete